MTKQQDVSQSVLMFDGLVFFLSSFEMYGFTPEAVLKGTPAVEMSLVDFEPADLFVQIVSVDFCAELFVPIL